MKYECKDCNFISNIKSKYENHLKTKKHLKIYNKYKINDNGLFECLICNKLFNYKTNIDRHYKTLHKDTNTIFKENNNQYNVYSDNLINNLLHQNNELIKKIDDKDKQIKEQNKQLETHKNELKEQNHELLQLIKELSIQKSNIHIENNTNNKTLNYNNITNYLNDKCADALNVEDFIPMIQISLNDLLNVSKMSRNKAVKTLLEKNLSLLEFNKQPFKCSDIKRKKIYAKTDGKWIQDNDYKQTNKVFRHINMESNMLSETPEAKTVLNNMDMSSYELRKPLSYGLDDDEINKNTDNEKKIMSEIVYYKNEDEN